MTYSKYWTRAGVTAALLALAAAAAPNTEAAVVVDLDNTGNSTVAVGQTIVARIAVSTNNPNGLNVLNVRITTSTASAGGTAASSPFLASVVPTTGTTGLSSVVTAFNPALNFPGETSILASGTATFVNDGSNIVPSNATGNRPLSGFTGQGTDGRGPAAFYSPGNAVLTYFADVTFLALKPGTLFFSLSPNPPTASEYNAATGTAATTVTPTLATGAGFSVNIVSAVVPEPASVGLAGVAALGLLARRRAAAN